MVANVTPGPARNSNSGCSPSGPTSRRLLGPPVPFRFGHHHRGLPTRSSRPRARGRAREPADRRRRGPTSVPERDCRLPVSLCVKWQAEMTQKFGLEFRIVDADLVRHLRRERGLAANPWRHFPRVIVSIDWLKRPRAMSLFREVRPTDSRAYSRAFDLLVTDEVHTLAGPGANSTRCPAASVARCRRPVPVPVLWTVSRPSAPPSRWAQLDRPQSRRKRSPCRESTPSAY